MSDSQQHAPYSTLGKHLRYLREQNLESLSEVSGAVEIDETVLERIEAGEERPAEEILMLLISHFNMQDQEAVQLWELAGYDGTGPAQKTDELLHDIQGQKSVIVLLGIDNRTMYSDHADIRADQAGIIMNFAQRGGQKQPLPVAKIGMSLEQAEQVLQQLQLAILKSRHLRQPKTLPPNTGSSPDVE